MDNKFYLTTAIPYVNAAPHIGFALELIQSDCIARFHRLLGEDVHFLTGSDENSLKNVQAAEQQGIPVKEFVDQNAAKFKSLKETLNLTVNGFIRTTEPRHFAGAQALWNACKKEDIYQKKYKGFYCVGCEAFLTEKDLVDGKCPEHQRQPEIVEEENYFFKLSNYQDWLEKLIGSNELKIIPETRKNEVLSFVKMGLEDFSISRSKQRAHSWGVPVPDDPQQIIYVWFDALANYITALDWQNNGQLFQKYWPADVHIIGKGISRFHAIYWPAMLKSAGLAIPKQIFIHGYVTVNGQKISKSLGNTIDPFEIVERYGADPVRYYLLREIPAYSDGDFSEARFKEVYNSELANGLGNLVARVAKLCEKSTVDFSAEEIVFDSQIKEKLVIFSLDEALKIIISWIAEINQLISTEQPWTSSGQELEEKLAKYVSVIRKIAYHLQSFIPETAEKILGQFKGPKIVSAEPLFPRKQ